MLTAHTTPEGDFTHRLAALTQGGLITPIHVLMSQTQAERQQITTLLIDSAWNAEQANPFLPTIQEFATALAQCTHLKTLIFEYNGFDKISLDDLTNICQAILMLPTLQSLEVRYNNVGQFTPDHIGVLTRTLPQCPALTTVKLHGNSLGELPPKQLKRLGSKLAKCEKLQTLDLSSNLNLSKNSGFTPLLTELSLSSSLTELDLSSNELNLSPITVFEALGDLVRLHSLHLRTNELGLVTIPTYRALCSNLSKLTGLSTIDLSRNCLDQIEAGIALSGTTEKLKLETLATALPKSCHVILNENRLTSVQKFLFEDNTSASPPPVTFQRAAFVSSSGEDSNEAPTNHYDPTVPLLNKCHR